LWRTATPASISEILVERPEPAIAIALAEILDEETLPMALRRLGQLPPMASLLGVGPALESVSAETQRKLHLMIAASSNDLAQVLQAAFRSGALGPTAGRNMAAAMLRMCRRAELDTLVPAIQSSHVAPGADDASTSLETMIEQVASWTHSPSE